MLKQQLDYFKFHNKKINKNKKKYNLSKYKFHLSDGPNSQKGLQGNNAVLGKHDHHVIHCYTLKKMHKCF